MKVEKNMSKYESKFWKKNWDPGLKDIDPKEFEISFTDAIQKTFDESSDKIALAFQGLEITFGEVEVQMQYQLSDLGAGGRQVALVTLDAIFQERLTKIAKKLPQLKLVITTSIIGMFSKEDQEKIRAVRELPTGKVTPLEGKVVLDFHDDVLAKYPTDPPNIKISPDDLAFIQLTHKNIVSDLLIIQTWLKWEKGKGIALSGFPFFHIAGLFFCINCIYLGWMQCLVPDPRDAMGICNQIKQYKPTALVNVPSLFQILINFRKFKRLDHSNLEVCISAASPFPKESQEQLEAIVGEGKLLEVYAWVKENYWKSTE